MKVIFFENVRKSTFFLLRISLNVIGAFFFHVSLFFVVFMLDPIHNYDRIWEKKPKKEKIKNHQIIEHSNSFSNHPHIFHPTFPNKSLEPHNLPFFPFVTCPPHANPPGIAILSHIPLTPPIAPLRIDPKANEIPLEILKNFHIFYEILWRCQFQRICLMSYVRWQNTVSYFQHVGVRLRFVQ